jgi:hypothetical protein
VSSVRNTGPGAYGLRLLGLDDEPLVRDALISAPEHWPAVSLEQRIADPPPAEPVVTSDWGRIALVDGGHALLDRRRRSVTLLSTRPVDADTLVHPMLAYVGAVFSNWLGRHAIHAGAFVVDGEAWALIGVNQAGKSSTLGWLARHGSLILADDLVVVEGARAFAGPRTLDLLPSSARYLQHDGLQVRGGGRHRITLEGVDPEVPLRGWIALSWGDALEARPIPAAERLGVLIDQLPIRLDGPGSAALLDLVALPGFELRRPKRLTTLPDAGAKIMELATS